MNNKLISNYLANSIIIITADFLGQQVSCLNIAQEVWKTKNMPEPIMLGTFSKAAQEAKDKILTAGLGEKADSLGELYYHTNQFFVPIEVFNAIEELKKDFSKVSAGIKIYETISIVQINVTDLGWWHSTSFKNGDDIQFKTNRVLSTIQDIRAAYAKRENT